MTPNRLEQSRVLVLAPGATPAAAANARGHLFEVFVANLLHLYGYEAPTASTVNVTSEGVELDVSATHRLSRSRAIAECKAYGRPVKATELTSFYGKLAVERFENPDTLGLFFAIPGLTSDGEEKARSIAEKDHEFIYLSARDIVERLEQEGVIVA
ncbi:MAG TPA: restriction endonuclease, partial [Rugosimonospora sp.]|nr:restriction endonuclease [Rugosimonospora sp.]